MQENNQNQKAKIYTRTGDNKDTSVYKCRVLKDDVIVEVEGTIDELMSNLMVTSSFLKDEKIIQILKNITKKLFVVGSDILGYTSNCIKETDVIEIEKLIDEYDKSLTPLNNFILPGCKTSSSFLHLSRSIVRRLERRIITLSKTKLISHEVLQYINRLSDLLFTLGRFEEEIND